MSGATRTEREIWKIGRLSIWGKLWGVPHAVLCQMLGLCAILIARRCPCLPSTCLYLHLPVTGVVCICVLFPRPGPRESPGPSHTSYMCFSSLRPWDLRSFDFLPIFTAPSSCPQSLLSTACTSQPVFTSFSCEGLHVPSTVAPSPFLRKSPNFSQTSSQLLSIYTWAVGNCQGRWPKDVICVIHISINCILKTLCLWSQPFVHTRSLKFDSLLKLQFLCSILIPLLGFPHKAEPEMKAYVQIVPWGIWF